MKLEVPYNIRIGFLLTIYAPMIYTTPCVMFFMRARTLRGGALEIETFHLGHKKLEISRAQPPRNVQAHIKNIRHRGGINHRCIGNFMYMRK